MNESVVPTQTLPTKRDLFGVGVSATTYADVVDAVISAAKERRGLAVTALATHGLMEAVHNADFGVVVNGLDIVTPDGQPLRWALNSLHGAGLTDRVYGPDLTRAVLAAMEREGLHAFFFGSTPETLDLLVSAVHATHPNLVIAGVQADRFREATPEEDRADVERITSSGAHVVFCGRGCPRQERWVRAHRESLAMPSLAVGAAFDYLAGNLQRPPKWMQDHGLEWLARLIQEPRRLWRRYLVTNAQFIWHFVIARSGIARSKKVNGSARSSASPTSSSKKEQ
jgi:exopolysaccharide biosynthesis WecB/TagA/CpsF family protein